MYYMWINKNLVHQVGDQTKDTYCLYVFILDAHEVYHDKKKYTDICFYEIKMH